MFSSIIPSSPNSSSIILLFGYKLILNTPIGEIRHDPYLLLDWRLEINLLMYFIPFNDKIKRRKLFTKMKVFRLVIRKYF